MAHQPMGAGGVEVEIGTGQPRPVKTLEERQAESALKREQAVQEAMILVTELQDSPGLTLVYQSLRDRMIELAVSDPQCQAFRKIITSWRSKLDPIPILADRIARHTLGPKLDILRSESQAAPE